MQEDQWLDMMRDIERRRDSLARLCMVAESAARVFFLLIAAGCALFVGAVTMTMVLLP
jgi:hypothetical protein